MTRTLTLGLVCLFVLTSTALARAGTFHAAIENAQPVAHWSFDDMPQTIGKSSEVSGPTAPEFPDFPESNPALSLQLGSRVELPDEGSGSRFDFDNGDEITVEALVHPSSLQSQAYIIGKGRTHNPGLPQTNQNWAFRLRDIGGRVAINLLFRSRPSDDGKHKGDWHRWTSTTGFAAGSGWHHVAITYRFGEPDSICGFIDGKQVKGTWDMGGPTTHPPVVDDDEIWIGSAMNGNPSNSFHGGLDEIALYRRVLPTAELESRFHWVEPPLVLPEAAPGVVQMHLHGPEADNSSFRNDPGSPLISWQQPWMGFVRIPHNYDDWGVRDDWGTGVFVRSVTELALDPGRYELLGRSRSLARLWIDGEEMLHFPQQKRGGGAHNEVQPVPDVPRQGMRPHAMGDVERLTTFISPGGKHTVIFDVMVGGPKLRLEFGETCVAIAREGEMFRLLGPEPGPELTDDGWLAFVETQQAALDELDRRNRLQADQQGDYWARRHELASAKLTGSHAHDSVASPANSSSAARQSNRNPGRQEPGIDELIQALLHAAAQGAGDADSFYNAQVRPILAQHCYRCHSEKEKGELDLRDRENLLAGGESAAPAVVPGNPTESYLLELVAPDADYRMPPKGEGLTVEQVAVLTKWVQAGATMETASPKISEPTPIVDELTFLRRVWIDLVGVVPPVDVLREFREDESPDKRDRMIERLLADRRWADNWMGYWQDVLAENPNLLKPNLNNTGPFRYWLLEAFQDNKPMDRFATELITMRGSTWGGGAAGFSVASQNDVPMAAKAHVIGTAFLGLEMKCARCHDSPYHETTQQDLFQMAAMLDRRPITVPKSSSVPSEFFDHLSLGGREPLIDVTLTIGSTVQPQWPFDDLHQDMPAGVIRNPTDPREQIAAEVTFSRRFAEVVVNRVWKRFMGAGLVEPVDDWEGNAPSDPALLALLADEFIRSGYDLKQLTKLIVSSDAYQREAIAPLKNSPGEQRFFQGPYRRRMTAEQVVDNAWHVAGRSMDVGQLTMDHEGRLAPDYFMNFGRPKHAWQFTTLANERDRPSLAMPRTQAVVDVLLAFGWRDSRQEPTSHRIEEPNPLQPGVLANGVMGGWLTRLTDDSQITQLCLTAESPDHLVEHLYLRFLTRPPTEDERQRFVALLSDRFEDRVVPKDKVEPAAEVERIQYVSWSNHLSSEANQIKQRQEEAARRGDPPTRYLRPQWRERAEDAVWALFNSPEMIWIP